MLISLPSLPLRLVNGANVREHWGARKRRAEHQRGLLRCVTRAHMLEAGALPAMLRYVRITRVGLGRLDYDGLVISAKHVLDGIADAVGINDRDLTVTYRQQRGSPYAVLVDISDGPLPNEKDLTRQ